MKYLFQSFIILIFISLTFSAAKAQSPKQKIIDRTSIGFQLRKSVKLGNHIYSTGFNESVSQAYPSIVKQNLELEPVWVDHFSRSGISNRFFSTIYASPTNELIMTGGIGASGDHALWIIKMDTLESIVWEKDLKTANDIGPNDFIPNSNGGGLILATEYGSQWNILLVDINENGDTLWTKKIVSSTGSSLRSPVGFWDGNNNLNVIIRNGNQKEILKLDPSGNILSYDLLSDGAGGALYVSAGFSDGTYTYLSGSQSGGTWTSFLLKMDSNNNIIWCKNYPELQYIYGLHKDYDGNIVGHGTINWGELLNKVEVVKFDTSGTPMIAKTFGQLPARHTVTSDILEINNHYLITGWREYQSSVTSYQLCLDGDLHSNSCYEKNINLSTLILTPSFTAIAPPTVSSLKPDVISYGNPLNFSYISGGIFVSYNLNNTINTEIELVGDDCGGICNGAAEATTTGGNPDYTYNWSNGQTGSSALNLCSDDTLALLTGDQLGCFVYDTIVVPQETPVNDICLVTVDATSTKNVVVWEKPVSNAIEGFTIYREVVGNYTVVGYVPYDSLSQFEDNTNGVNPNITSYRYKITTIDTCGNESELSDFHETIHLTVNQGAGSTVNLIWDNYEGFPFSYNRILRDSLGDGNWVVKDSVSSNVFTWTDNNSPSSATEYLIEVVSPYICSATKAQDHNSTRSNRSNIFGGGGIANSISEVNSIEFVVYPNPANDLINIKHAFSEPTFVYVTDISGRIILESNQVQQSEQISLSGLKKGIYIIQLNSGDKKLNKRIILE